MPPCQYERYMVSKKQQNDLLDGEEEKSWIYWN